MRLANRMNSIQKTFHGARSKLVLLMESILFHHTCSQNSLQVCLFQSTVQQQAVTPNTK